MRILFGSPRSLVRRRALDTINDFTSPGYSFSNALSPWLGRNEQPPLAGGGGLGAGALGTAGDRGVPTQKCVGTHLGNPYAQFCDYGSIDLCFVERGVVYRLFDLAADGA
jgi:hypothetical protein